MNSEDEDTDADHAQAEALHQIEDWLELPMVVLGLAWVGLLVVELVWGAGPVVEMAGTAIWVIFLLEFGFKLVIAPRKGEHLRRNWLSVLALALPALRVFRVARVLKLLRAGRAVRGIALARVLTSFNRGFRSLQRSIGRYGFGYVAMLTLLVTLLGSAGMYAFERTGGGPGQLEDFGEALWFTAMLMTTSGSDYWPRSVEGRLLCFLLALYAFAIFGYVTATIAALLLGPVGPSSAQDNDQRDGLAELCGEVSALREEIRRLASSTPPPRPLDA